VLVVVGVLGIVAAPLRKDPKRSGQDALTGEDNSRTLTAFSENGSQRGLLPTTACLQDHHCPFGKTNYNYCFSVQVAQKNKIKVFMVCDVCEDPSSAGRNV
jgi:hypothetical protein